MVPMNGLNVLTVYSDAYDYAAAGTYLAFKTVKTLNSQYVNYDTQLGVVTILQEGNYSFFMDAYLILQGGKPSYSTITLLQNGLAVNTTALTIYSSMISEATALTSISVEAGTRLVPLYNGDLAKYNGSIQLFYNM